MRPTGITGTSSSGIDLGRVEDVEAELVGLLFGEDLQAELPLRDTSPASIASHRSRRWKSGSAPEILTASSQTSECVPEQRLPVELDEARFARRR